MTMRDPMTLQCQQHAPAVQGENSTNGHIPDRLSVALAHYLDLMDQGIAPEPTDYVRSFPDVAEALLECLCTLQWIDTAKRQSLSNDKMSSRGPIADEVRALSHGMLSHYRLLSPLGHGGMGVVYQAVDTRTGVGVALKILPHRSLTDAKAMVRFFNEAQIASTLEHPHIVKVTDVGSERGVPFFVMPQANPRHTHFPRVLGSLGRPVAAFPILPSLRRKGLCLRSLSVWVDLSRLFPFFLACVEKVCAFDRIRAFGRFRSQPIQSSQSKSSQSKTHSFSTGFRQSG